ncbi:MAG TPA: ABC transporter ATP-binding protein [Verrucomicrobiae bacterium]|jgi:ABC-type Fe3+/spermidine/putrescine transport system ATPase subunit|nr:ABC transporter ATP-binding protein [Verrucomicrobiae bacterium]
MSTVRLASITKHFGTTVAVHEFDLEVADGEFVTLLGPSGCGKTTTLRMIAGLVEPTGGRVWFDDQDVTFLPPRARNIGFVFQTPALFPHLSVAENVGFGLSVKGARKAAIASRVEEMLAMVDLTGYGARTPSQLSGGQQQRVALARVLATDPRVLLFDEPLSALDKNLRESLKFAIRELQRRTGKTSIYVTHDQSEAFAISDRIVVMNGGRVEQIGSQTEIYLRPRTGFVAEFIGANNALPGTVVALEPVSGTSGQSGEHRFRIRSGELTLSCRSRLPVALGDAVVAYLRPEDLAVVDDDGAEYRNVVEGEVERVIFEGPTAQLRIRVAGREMRVDVGGSRRLTLTEGDRRVRLGFDDLNVVPADTASADGGSGGSGGSGGDGSAEPVSA